MALAPAATTHLVWWMNQRSTSKAHCFSLRRGTQASRGISTLGKWGGVGAGLSVLHNREKVNILKTISALSTRNLSFLLVNSRHVGARSLPWPRLWEASHQAELLGPLHQAHLLVHFDPQLKSKKGFQNVLIQPPFPRSPRGPVHPLRSFCICSRPLNEVTQMMTPGGSLLSRASPAPRPSWPGAWGADAPQERLKGLENLL